MAVKIRLARIGKKNAPIFRIVAIDSRRQRDGAALEILGTYNPCTGAIVQYNAAAVEAWVQKGAIVTDAVKKIQKLQRNAEVAA